MQVVFKFTVESLWSLKMQINQYVVCLRSSNLMYCFVEAQIILLYIYI